jgi:hypothetical protein
MVLGWFLAVLSEDRQHSLEGNPMWARLKSLPLRVKIIALVVFLGLGWLYKRNESHSSSSYVSRSSYSSSAESASRNSGSADSNSADSSHVLFQLQAQLNQMNAENAQCYMQIQQMNPSNYAAPPCEAQMQWRTAQIAKLQAEVYRLQTGANVQPVDFALMGSGSGSGSSGSGGSNDDGSNAVNRYSREAILGQSNYRDSEGNEYQLANRAYYFRDRASGTIVGSDFGTPPDNQNDWEQLTYQAN